MKKLNKQTMKTWDEFVHKYTPEYIRNEMTIDDYVIGKGSNNKSFCYIVERSLDELGGIRGANASKFGIYYSKNQGKYIPTKRFGKTVDDTFNKIKEELSSLIERTQKLKKFQDIESMFNGMFKYKVMYLYNPEIMVPSFVDSDLKYFCDKLNIKSGKTYEKFQHQLIDYYLSNPSSEYQSLHQFMQYLYEKYGRNISNDATRANKTADDELKDKVRKFDSKKLQNFVPSTEINKFSIKEQQKVYKRDPRCSLIALMNANYKCEIDEEHYSFERRKDSTNYVEAHHLIPMQFQDEFDVNIDIPENIVSLCSNCHNEIHYGKNADHLIEILYHKRIGLLLSKHIDITLEQLLMMYHKTNE